MGEKPRLPDGLLPNDIVSHINKFIPKNPAKRIRPVSPQMQKDLKAIQLRNLKGIKETYLYDFEDFLLD